MNSLVEATKNLTQLSMSYMCLNVQAMQVLIFMLKKILESNAPLQHLELRSFSEKSYEGRQVMEALMASKKSFETLILRDLPEWFEDE